MAAKTRLKLGAVVLAAALPLSGVSVANALSVSENAELTQSQLEYARNEGLTPEQIEEAQ
ncbi:hypothetical protein [Corynebacterium liangguodongii]|uniref:hypothetical protein n=1 Tax=Corynebacterium liangguodongii TaxID=2079535 RepID=UPI0011B27EFB|nr:hypothetical protein [Corynebacterium liangguodongii]